MAKFTLADFIDRFPDDLSCRKEVIKLKGGFKCKCGSSNGYHLKNRPIMVCRDCHYHTSILKGTIFEKSRTPLRLWFYAVYLMTKICCGVPAKQIQRELGVTYKTAWRMMNLIRSTMKPNIKAFDGIVEVDETFVGGRGRNRARVFYVPEYDKKQIIMGFLDRKAKMVRPIHIDNTGKWTLLNQIRNNVRLGSQIYSDQYVGYQNLPREGYLHDSINHNIRFVDGDAHTQNLENFWSHFKRGVTGVYRQVSPKYVQAYAEEFAFRYNHRDLGDGMFWELLKRSLQPA